MAHLLVNNLDPHLIEKLKVRSQRHGRSLDEELKLILQQAVATEGMEQVRDWADAAAKLAAAQARYAGQNFSDSTELIREDRQR